MRHLLKMASVLRKGSNQRSFFRSTVTAGFLLVYLIRDVKVYSLCKSFVACVFTLVKDALFFCVCVVFSGCTLAHLQSQWHNGWLFFLLNLSAPKGQ